MDPIDKKTNESWHSLPIKKVMDKLQTTREGHSSSEALARQLKFGPNVLCKKRISPQRLFLNQLNHLLIIILLLAVFLSCFL